MARTPAVAKMARAQEALLMAEVSGDDDAIARAEAAIAEVEAETARKFRSTDRDRLQSRLLDQAADAGDPIAQALTGRLTAGEVENLHRQGRLDPYLTDAELSWLKEQPSQAIRHVLLSRKAPGIVALTEKPRRKDQYQLAARGYIDPHEWDTIRRLLTQKARGQ